MCRTTEFTFYPGSLPNLVEYVVVKSVNYVEAKKRVLKWIATGRTDEHVTEYCVRIGVYCEGDPS